MRKHILAWLALMSSLRFLWFLLYIERFYRISRVFSKCKEGNSVKRMENPTLHCSWQVEFDQRRYTASSLSSSFFLSTNLLNSPPKMPRWRRHKKKKKKKCLLKDFNVAHSALISSAPPPSSSPLSFYLFSEINFFPFHQLASFFFHGIHLHQNKIEEKRKSTKVIGSIFEKYIFLWHNVWMDTRGGRRRMY